MKNPANIHVMLVDDHFMVRLGLCEAIRAEPGLEVIAECGDAEAAIAHYVQRRPDVVLMDERLPGLDGIAATDRILRMDPTGRVAILTIFDDEESIFRAFKVGAAGFIPKSVDRNDLLTAIRTLHSGGSCFPPPIRERLQRRMSRPELTPRELQVLHWIVHGRSNKEIAAELSITEPTVKLHVRNMLDKLQALDRTQATTAAIQRGIIRLD